MMNKFITGLILVWLVVLTAFSCYAIKAERELLKFADFVLTDNLKNVVQSGGVTFYVVNMDPFSKAKVLTDIPLWQPVYVKDTDMGKLMDWQRKYILMIRNFNNLDFNSKIAAAKANQYLKKRLAGQKK